MSERDIRDTSDYTESLTMRRLVDDACTRLIDDFPELHAPFGLVSADGKTAQANDIVDYDSLAQLFGSTFTFALRTVVDRSGIDAVTWNSHAADELRQRVKRVNDAPVNGMFTFARILEAVPQVVRRERRLEPYSADQLTQIAVNSTELTSLLASNNSHFSRLVLGELALAPHPFYSKDGHLIQREVLNPAEFVLDGNESNVKLKIKKSKDELTAAVVEMHSRLDGLAKNGTTPELSRKGRCYAFEHLAAIQGRMALVAGMTLYAADAKLSVPQLPGTPALYDEGPVLVQNAWNNAFQFEEEP